jgi:hypothetical protein
MGQEGRRDMHTMLLLDLLVQLLQTLILGRETAFRGRVDDEDDFAFVFLEGNGLAFLCLRHRISFHLFQIIPAHPRNANRGSEVGGRR